MTFSTKENSEDDFIMIDHLRKQAGFDL